MNEVITDKDKTTKIYEEKLTILNEKLKNKEKIINENNDKYYNMNKEIDKLNKEKTDQIKNIKALEFNIEKKNKRNK